ncbi:hypothetical protein A0H76_741 [Hepatospora eriocheir]|uniref:Mitochondrial import inner membrane translocase subunit TIM22 n=1 Tax=Hepatospora eriocheir TaxID=1081669 RepID=A0A1X0QAL6_9MICR|nr:hypothetical protein HERIO_1273 [Hepatospora eriocheir]ORE00452.1 hypothetical protein A0H76_741 [Hepatospora eriocheir]
MENKNEGMSVKILDKFKQLINSLLKGYILGSFVGVLSPHNESLSYNIHFTGLKFAQVNCVYSSTNYLLTKVFNKSNRKTSAFISGVCAGLVCVNRYKIIGSVMFGTFASITDL